VLIALGILFAMLRLRRRYDCSPSDGRQRFIAADDDDDDEVLRQPPATCNVTINPVDQLLQQHHQVKLVNVGPVTPVFKMVVGVHPFLK